MTVETWLIESCGSAFMNAAIKVALTIKIFAGEL